MTQMSCNFYAKKKKISKIILWLWSVRSVPRSNSRYSCLNVKSLFRKETFFNWYKIYSDVIDGWIDVTRVHSFSLASVYVWVFDWLSNLFSSRNTIWVALKFFKVIFQFSISRWLKTDSRGLNYCNTRN